jgi:hypothetical protein
LTRSWLETCVAHQHAEKAMALFFTLSMTIEYRTDLRWAWAVVSSVRMLKTTVCWSVVTVAVTVVVISVVVVVVAVVMVNVFVHCRLAMDSVAVIMTMIGHRL